MLPVTNEDFWTFVDTHAGADIAALRLKWHGKPSPGFDVDFAITQIECRRRFGKKLSATLADNPRFIFPDTLAGEQATSDMLAEYHTTIVPAGKRVCDLTAGLGIDSLHLSANGDILTAVEIDATKAEALSLNSQGRFMVCCADCRDIVAEAADDAFDFLFIDPHRRGEKGERVYSLAQCAPDVTAMLPQLRKVASMLVIKASPMLDISHTTSLLPGIKRIIALGTSTECKELIAIVDLKDHTVDNYTISAVTLHRMGSHSSFDFTPSEEKDATCNFDTPKEGDLIFEPSPSLMKAAPYNLIAQRYGLRKISANTHVYFSDVPVEDFDGFVYHIERVIPYESKYLKRLHKEYPRLSVATRNFGISADDLRRKLKVDDGGDYRLLAITLADSKKVLLLLSHPD